MSFFEFPHTRTYDSDLGFIIRQIKALMECCDSMNDWKTQHEAEYNQLKALYDAVMSGNFPPEIEAGFTRWMQENGLELVGNLVKMVMFGLTPDGYLYADIPEYWSDVTFNTTGYDIGIAGYDFGHLVISY